MRDMESTEPPSILLPAAYDVVWSVVAVVVIVAIVIALVALVRFARAGRRARAASAALDEARLELVRERTARLRAGLPDAGGADPEDPAA
ncbi:hypothetical protein DOU09_15030 [Clavibacter michiganensis subsp. michiganensis]|nr:hypothetical protein [Clavibacter michiganensis]MWJ05118.1 hypothetical protein [Clavibacter michiganensis subsp. michiganensis]MWJ11109.1 hypothetical protein [Clavibacter michiganensis subsp. michiganensis]MWJ17196.1 hypothetical protein [Clavibacter michiganensis subsp. michiganensis]MWJ23484.1 hypothetical protein [Clavibacter michiganensis subsp. michiganensis]MWJ46156.1 hypothetical protein [Clavibacter michiganensis subsp. michiganensis]